MPPILAMEEKKEDKKMETMETLAGGIAHDLNNVLAVIFAYAELLQEKLPQGNHLRPYVDNILASGEKGAAIIQDMLTLTRKDAPTAKVVNINKVISDCLKTPTFQKIQTYHSGVTFRTELADGLLNIGGAPTHLEKTVMNLLSNAAKAVSNSGEVVIRTEKRYLGNPLPGGDEIAVGEYAVLTISDTGVGISEAEIALIFEPFYTTQTLGRGGTGLELPIVRKTVRDHDGYIEVKSEAGAGSTFTLYFPLAGGELSMEQQEMPLEPFMGRGESILVVDDMPAQRDLATRMLKRLGYNVRAVANGFEAVQYLRDHPADLVVLDMVMDQGMDGLETYERILEISPGQRAVIVSGFSETDRVMKAQKLGAGPYVRKPYLLQELGLAVRNNLSPVPLTAGQGDSEIGNCS